MKYKEFKKQVWSVPETKYQTPSKDRTWWRQTQGRQWRPLGAGKSQSSSDHKLTPCALKACHVAVGTPQSRLGARDEDPRSSCPTLLRDLVGKAWLLFRWRLDLSPSGPRIICLLEYDYKDTYTIKENTKKYYLKLHHPEI